MGTELNAQRADHALRVVGLAIWRQLYAMVWITFLQIIIAVVNIPSSNVFLVYGHVILGLVILGLAHYNNAQFKKTEAPNRLKRIVKSTAILATIQVLLGIPIFVNTMLIFSIPMVWIISLLHLVIALAIITQASSVATAYDMWEEKEYTKT
jgi:amino acid transporter